MYVCRNVFREYNIFYLASMLADGDDRVAVFAEHADSFIGVALGIFGGADDECEFI
jgi:hypothetical protein